MFTWYCVHEKVSYQDIAPGLREDVGGYAVCKYDADSVKELLINGSGYSESYIKEFIFENKQDAYKLALSLTVTKLQKVFDKIKRYETSRKVPNKN